MKGKANATRHCSRSVYLKNRLFSVSMEWHSRLLLLTSAVFTTLVQWIGALQKNTPNPLGRACSRQEVRCKGTANESPGMIAGSTTGSATEIRVSTFRQWFCTQTLTISGQQTDYTYWLLGNIPTEETELWQQILVEHLLYSRQSKHTVRSWWAVQS
jgi:hypothetical protein